jgi:hypothetical protein
MNLPLFSSLYRFEDRQSHHSMDHWVYIGLGASGLVSWTGQCGRKGAGREGERTGLTVAALEAMAVIAQ